MRKITKELILTMCLFFVVFDASAQYKNKKNKHAIDTVKTESQLILEKADSSESPVIINLDQAIQIALSENVAIKVADKEVTRTGYAKQGSYSALYPKIDISGNYQRTIKKQVMYMDIDMSELAGPGGGAPSGPGAGGADPGAGGSKPGNDSAKPSQGADAASNPMADGLEVGRWNTWNAGVTASMPIINAQLWKSIKISALDVEVAVEKARSSRLETVAQVKSAYYSTLFAKEAFEVYKEVYENAVKNFEETQKKYRAEKVSELEFIRAKTTVASAVPNVYEAESNVILSLWQLKAILGVDLDLNIDIAGSLGDFSDQMFYDIHQHDSISLANNTTMKTLALQTEQLAHAIKVQQFACIPTLSAVFNFSMNAMTNDFKFSNYRWTPYSYVGLSLNIPIFSGLKRHNDTRQAKNRYEQIQLQSLDAERNLKIAIRKHLNTMETSMKSYVAGQNTVAAAQKGYDIAERSYQLGGSTLIELNDAQLALTQSKLSELQAIYNFVVAKTQLEQTLGQDFVNE